GSSVVRIITRKDVTGLIDNLKMAEYGVTSIDAQGVKGPVRIVFTVVQRKELDRVVAIIHRFDPKAFYSVDDLQAAAEGIFPSMTRRARAGIPFSFGLERANV